MAKKVKKKKSKEAKGKAVLVVLAEKTLNFARLEAGEWYNGVFEEYATGEGKYGMWCRLEFKVRDGQTEDGESAKGESISGFTNYEVAPGTLLYDAVCAFTGQKELEPDEEIDLEAYYGCKCRIFIEDRKVKKGETYTGRQTVSKIKPVKSKKKDKSKKKGKK